MKFGMLSLLRTCLGSGGLPITASKRSDLSSIALSAHPRKSDARMLTSERPAEAARSLAFFASVYPDSLRKRKYLAKSFRKDSCCGMICAGFLSTTERAELIELARNGLVEHRLARRANALALLDQGMSCSDVGAVRTWFRLYSEEGTEGLAGFGYEGRDGHLKARQTN